MQYNRIIGEKSVCILLSVLIFTSLGYPQQWDLRGQLTSSANLHNDPIIRITEFDQRVGYIPTISVYPEYEYLSKLDFEAAFNLQANFDGLLGAEVNRNYDTHEIHRLWGRYNSENLELRYGIQKIAFGPGLILRPLRWFDSLNLKDPTGQTNGVTALQLKYFWGHEITYWGWLIHPEDSKISSRGGRIEISFPGLGDLGASYHHRPAYINGEVPKRSGINFGFSNAGEDRYGFDIRTDIVIGLWVEGAVSNSFDGDFFSESNNRVYMAGGDYTIPIKNGLYFMTEQLLYILDNNYLKEKHKLKLSAAMLTYPLGMLDQLYYITEYNWDEELSFNFLRYSRTYDNYSFNIILQANQVKDFYIGKGGTIEVDKKIQKAVELLIIYNH